MSRVCSLPRCWPSPSATTNTYNTDFTTLSRQTTIKVLAWTVQPHGRPGGLAAQSAGAVLVGVAVELETLMGGNLLTGHGVLGHPGQ
ncbi:MAG: hypothetical protein EP343_23945 [Deltaproteobacteria bacterium]|nr:MAG: hypothetical protein EP343_23945 [Deltaproteobacteria bacterium]